MKPGCLGKSDTNNLPAPTDLTENPYGEKKLIFRDATKISASVVLSRILFWIVPRRPIFEKCSHLREKGGVLTLRTLHWVCADPYSMAILENCQLVIYESVIILIRIHLY
jgi:hypothetical protein